MGKTRWKNLLLSMLLVLLVVGMLLYIKEKAGDTGQTEATLVEQTEDQRHPLKQELQNLRLPGRGTAVVCVEAYVSNDCEQPGMMVFPVIVCTGGLGSAPAPPCTFSWSRIRRFPPGMSGCQTWRKWPARTNMR